MSRDMDGALPTGTLTFVLGDVASSTRWWETEPEAMGVAITSWYSLIRSLVDQHEGWFPLEQGEGDSFVAAFQHASAAAEFALDLSRAAPDDTAGLPLMTRIGVHTGEALLRDQSNYMGEALNRCARLRNLASGGQILVSGATASLLVDQLAGGAFLKDLGMHRLRDLGRAEHIRQLCDRDVVIEFPQLRSVDRLPNNLPVQLTSFVGREDELRDIADVLQKARIVTLTGTGGSGKTRLAVQVAAEVLEAFPGGVWLVDLAAIEEPSLVGESVMAAMGISEGVRRSPVDSVADAIGDESTLLVLDNCEHLIQAVADLVEAVVATCLGVTILTTSREPLAVDGEHCVRVPPLSLPSDQGDRRCESVALFADRAKLARPTFVLSDENIGSVTEICRRLDGIPLAIELAAARCRAIAPAGIAEQLGDHFRLLTGGRRNALARQRTLEASVEWSHNLLDERSRALFRSLSVFVGGCTLDAAESVCATEGLPEWEIVELLTGLVDKSLLQFEERGSNMRYRMLETIRHYAQERLVESGEAVTTREAHTRYYTAMTAAARAGLEGPEVGFWIDRLEVEIDNLRAAYDWYVDSGREREALQQMLSVWIFWHLARGPEALERLERVLFAAGDERPRALFAAAWMAWLLNDFESSVAWSHEALDLARSSDDEIVLGCASTCAGWNEMWAGDEGGAALLDEGIALLRNSNESWYYVDAVWGLGTYHTVVTGDMTAARAAFEESVRASRRAGNPMLAGRSLILLALPLLNLGLLDEAAEVLREGRTLLDPFADSWLLWADAYECMLLTETGRTSDASRVARRALDDRRHQLVVAASFVAYTDALALHAGAPPEIPIPELAVAEERCRKAMLLAAAATCRAARGWRAAASGDLASGRRLVDEAKSLCDETFLATPSIGLVLHISAVVALLEGDLVRAESEAFSALMTNHPNWHSLALDSLELVALLTANGEKPTGSARLLGAVKAERDRVCCPRPVVFDEAYARDLELDRVRTVLGDAGTDEAMVAGAAMTVEDAVAYATRGRGARTRPATGWASLTPTELDVVALVAEGLRNADIASRLFVSTSTVKTHLNHVFTKLGVSSRSELVTIAVRNT